MASLARGLVLPCRQLFPRCPRGVGLRPDAWTASAPRCFTATVRLGVAAEAAPKKPPGPAKPVTGPTKPPTPPADARPPAAPSRYAFIKSLAAKQTPTTLYEAPSHFWFYFGCWTSGLSIIAWTALTGPASVNQPEGVPQWVGVVFGTSYVLLGAMGFYLISKTPNVVASIRLLPAAAARGASTGAGPRAAGAPQLEVTVKRMVPFLQPKVVTTSLDNVALQSRFSLPEEYVPELRRLARQREEEARRQELRRYDMEHLLTMPFRRIGRALVDMFRGVRAAWSDMGFGVIRVDGKQYKVDVTKGFAHDGFRTIERLVAVGFR